MNVDSLNFYYLAAVKLCLDATLILHSHRRKSLAKFTEVLKLQKALIKNIARVKSNIPRPPILPRIVPSSRPDELPPLARQLVATINDRRLAGVEMTCVSVTFGERIKDGLCRRCRTEGARRSRRSRHAQETGTTVGPFFFL